MSTKTMLQIVKNVNFGNNDGAKELSLNFEA